MTAPRMPSILLLSIALGPSCLPVDTRTPPASVLVTVRGTPHIKNGISATEMDDGWSITFDKFLVSFGQAELQGDPCTPYSDADYRRIFDGRTLEPQKASILYALGTCTFAARGGWADPDSPLAEGVTADDAILMRTPGTDSYAGPNAGLTVYVAGRAEKDGVTKTFSWPFRARRVAYGNCTNKLEDEVPAQLVLQPNAALTVDLTLRADVLFRDRIDPATARLRFGPMAAADDAHGDKNGDVTLEELGSMTLAEAGITAEEEIVGDAAVPEWKTFEDFVYLGLFPRVVGLNDTGQCHADVRLIRAPD